MAHDADPRSIPPGEGVLAFPALEQALRGAVARSAASVHIVGRPGGLLRLHGRQVVDAWTVGTPLGVPSPGRRTRDDAVPRQPARFTAIADILFAIATGPVHAVWEEPDPPAEPDGIDLEHLLRETRRRLAVISLGGRLAAARRHPAHGDGRRRHPPALHPGADGARTRRQRPDRPARHRVPGRPRALRGHPRRAALRRDRAPRGRSPRGSRGATCRGTGAAASGDGARRCAARAGGRCTGGPRPTTPAPDRTAADVVLGLFSRRRRQPPAAAATTANGVAPQLSRRVPRSSGMARPDENRSS